MTIKTLGELNFLPTKQNPSGQTSAIISAEEYAISKHTGSYKKIPLSGVQVIDEVINRIKLHIPDKVAGFGDIYTYRDNFFVPGVLKSQINAETTIDQIAFDRVIGVVDILDTPNQSMRLAMKYQNDDYVEFAIGLNLHVCSNFNIMNSGCRWKTNKRDGTTIEVLFDKLEEFIKDREKFFGMSLQKMNTLSQRLITQDNVEEMLGELLIAARKPDTIMIGTNEVSAMADEVLRNHPNSMWDFLQAGTQVIKFNSSNGSSTLDSLESIGRYVTEKSGLVWEDAQVV